MTTIPDSQFRYFENDGVIAKNTLRSVVGWLFKEYEDVEGNRVFCANLEDGYLYLWNDGNTHHSYRRPDLLGYTEVGDE